tara:strand:+ start:696 stop:1820 length:1125 start_codon:yes stop_codon:yes gene_type:complete
MDEFYRGADLGLKVSSQRQQQRQFEDSLSFKKASQLQQQGQFDDSLAFKRDSQQQQQSQFDSNLSFKQSESDIQVSQFEKTMAFSKERAKTQAEQFTTNLAEKARQADLSFGLSLEQQTLKEKQFTHNVEVAVIQSKVDKVNIARLQANNQREKRLVTEMEQYGPLVTSYEMALQDWDGNEKIPVMPAGLPPAQRKQALEMREQAEARQLTGRHAKNQQKFDALQQKLFEEGFEFLVENNPTLIYQDPQSGQNTYDYPKYLAAKQEFNVKRTQDVYGRSGGMEPSSTTVTDKRTGASTIYTPRSKSSNIRQELGMKNLSDFMQEDDDGNVTFNQNALDDAVKAITGAARSRESINRIEDIPNSRSLRNSSGWRD